AEEAPAGEQSIADIAVADGNFTTLVAALDAAGLVETLAGDGEFTVFAPTDDAFAALPEGTVEGLLEDPEGALTDILLYHVVDGAIPAETIVTLDSVTTLQGDDVKITVTDDGVVLNDTVNVTATDIAASNGIIHVIDAVLIPPSGEEAAADEAMAQGDGEPTFLDRALEGEFDGSEVSILTVYTDAEEALFNEQLAQFTEATGIDVNHSATKEFETQIVVQIDGGNPPDLTMFPQPGLASTYVADGTIADVRDFIPESDLQERYTQGWLDSATFAGPDGEEVMGGVWYRAANKDLVWYPKALFDEAGYTVPTTWDELIELSDTIVADGDAPWCIGIESGVATGWVATDWVERLMLRTAPPEDYDAWVAGELPFASDQVKNAAELMSVIWLNPDYVLGGTNQILTEAIQDSPVHMFEDPPTCWMHVQASWVQGFFPEDAVPGEDYDFFYFPSVDPAYGEPVLMAGDLMTLLVDKPEAKALLEYLSTGQSMEVFMRNGSALSPHQDSDPAWYGSEIDTRQAEILLNAETVRFDASDLMPGEVGAGTFWERMVDYISGTIDLDTALQEIDASWPQ
ncbi:MAG: extracellular solute-binding protein, partial [Anaerolineae bacterium]